jgi:hypothetical protein
MIFGSSNGEVTAKALSGNRPVRPFDGAKKDAFAYSDPGNPIIFENPVARVQKIANLCGPTQ